ncbi:MAG: 4a-hydroxytetrahydrobiopterin dehydratase [Novosphingobium sp.]
MIEVLSPTQRDEALGELQDWNYDAERDALHREITPADFCQAFALMTRIAFEAEKNDHHPEWSNVYNRISIWLKTHEANGISLRDLKMAREINKIIL